MYYKIPLNSDLSHTSYSFYEEIDNQYYICFNEGYVGDDWEQISDYTMQSLLPELFRDTENEDVFEEPSQLDRIEFAVQKSHAELRQEGADALTEELIEMGVL